MGVTLLRLVYFLKKDKLKEIHPGQCTNVISVVRHLETEYAIFVKKAVAHHAWQTIEQGVRNATSKNVDQDGKNF